MIDCSNCGLAFESRHANGLYYDEEEYTCEDCGAVNRIAVDVEDDDCEAYVIGWTCKHGVDGETECGACEADEKHKHRASE